MKEKRESLKKKIITGLTTIALLSFPNISRAHFPIRYVVSETSSYHSIHHRTRWSPYAFTAKTSGLVSGDLTYSMHAFSVNHNGLVDRDLRYSPYAFSHDHNGLIKDNGSKRYPASLHFCQDFQVINIITCNYQPLNCNDNDREQEDSAERLKTRRENLAIQSERRAEINKIIANDGREIISEYFKNRSIDFKTDQIFNKNNKILSANFIFGDKKTIIKYWNPEEIRSLAQQPEYVRNFFKNYEKRWEDFCEENNKKEDKWKIHTIEASNKEEILNRLESIVFN